MLCKCWKILSATFSRLFFALHGTIMVFLAAHVKKDFSYLFLLIGIVLLFVEMSVTLQMTEHGEWKWFSPVVFIYLCSVIPSLFVMELEYLRYRTNKSDDINISKTTGAHCTKNDNNYSRIVQSVEECTILVLIIGRWLMPRGKMNRDQLAQLLLTYLALGADILDILELMKEPSVKTNKTITVVGLCLFTWAVMQFTLVLTQPLPTSSPGTEENEQLQSESDINTCVLSLCCTDEVLSVMIAVGMQDGPFLIYRLYLVTREGVFNDSMTFFICKNFLSVIIQVYRVVVFLCNKNHKSKTCNP
ncbi:transmembrane protein 26-like [Rhinoderma darwinii]|uniref:transmembrane protein 26-like n=1 Tax=Rhinoderma darwinii TaxID=43563 RepID=UPI003F666451